MKYTPIGKDFLHVRGQRQFARRVLPDAARTGLDQQAALRVVQEAG